MTTGTMKAQTAKKITRKPAQKQVKPTQTTTQAPLPADPTANLSVAAKPTKTAAKTTINTAEFVRIWKLFWVWVKDKGALFLAVAFQAYVVALYTFQELQKVTAGMGGFIEYTNVIFSTASGLSLDLVVVTTALSNDKKTKWHLATLIAAWVASSAITFNFFPGENTQKILHVSWSTLIFLFSISRSHGMFDWSKKDA